MRRCFWQSPLSPFSGTRGSTPGHSALSLFHRGNVTRKTKAHSVNTQTLARGWRNSLLTVAPFNCASLSLTLSRRDGRTARRSAYPRRRRRRRMYRARARRFNGEDGRTDGRGVRSFVFSRSRTRCGVWNWIWNGGALMLAARAAHSLPIMYSYLRPPLFSNPSSDFGVGRSVGRSVGRTLTKRRAKSKAAAAAAATVTPTTSRRGRRRAVVSFLNESRVWLSGCGRIGGVRLCREIFVVGLLE